MNSEGIQRIALIGGGVIGSGWAIRCLAHGLSVVVTDPCLLYTSPSSRDYAASRMPSSA